MTPADGGLLRRARPLLGTLVSIEVRAPAADPAVLQAVEAAFATIAEIHRAMSAHAADSDLARLARATGGTPLKVHPHTAAVLRLAQAWARASAGAFDPLAAGRQLARRGLRPGLRAPVDGQGSLHALRIAADGTVLADGPLQLDLGGIAKGYAVDRAVDTLRRGGVTSGLVNAGGDLRAFGPHGWPVEVRHAAAASRTQRLLRLREAALASSNGPAHNAEFVPTTRRRAAAWRRATVLARDCASADALTKWALQSRAPSLQLRATLRRLGARLWRD